MPILQRITPDAATAPRVIRLQALQEDPTAFGSTCADESQLSKTDWLKRAADCSSETSVGYFAVDQGLPCGVVRGYLDEKDPQRAHVASMWVAPSYRRTGIGSYLINSIQMWAEARGVRELRLMVTNSNRGAIAFYE